MYWHRTQMHPVRLLRDLVTPWMTNPYAISADTTPRRTGSPTQSSAVAALTACARMGLMAGTTV